MIEVEYRSKVYSFSSNTGCLAIKEAINEKDCIGLINKETQEIYDLHSQVTGPAELKVLFLNEDASLKLLRSTLALIMADCINGELVDIELNDSGFACKFFMDETISQLEFSNIKSAMLKKIKSAMHIKRDALSYEDSQEIGNFYASKAQEGPNEWYSFGNVKIISDLSFLTNSKLCSNSFEVIKVAQEDFEGKKIQKLTCAAFFDDEKLQEYIDHMEFLKKHDHRTIGKQQELFYMIDQAPGSVFWLPKGWQLFRALESFIRRKTLSEYQEVRTPFVKSTSFWEKSGHLAVFSKNMMFVNMGNDSQKEEAALKPMNCPAHIEIFKHKTRSYKDLPLRIAEFGICHRYEPSGALHGLMRVRSFTIDDGHIFCMMEQIKAEVKMFMKQAIDVYKTLTFDDIKLIIATRPEKFLGQKDSWDYAEKTLCEALKEIDLDFEIAEGEGAFYGPKIEMHVNDSMGRMWQLGTIQLDFVLPERLDINYTDSDGESKRPCMLHRAVVGSLERFIAVLLEHTKGNLPLFLAPEQVVICSVVSDVNEYANKVYEEIKSHGIIVKFDDRNQTLGYKIREHKLNKIPMIIIIGKKEAADGTFTLEYLNKKIIYDINKMEEFLKEFISNDGK